MSDPIGAPHREPLMFATAGESLRFVPGSIGFPAAHPLGERAAGGLADRVRQWLVAGGAHGGAAGAGGTASDLARLWHH